MKNRASAELPLGAVGGVTASGSPCCAALDADGCVVHAAPVEVEVEFHRAQTRSIYPWLGSELEVFTAALIDAVPTTFVPHGSRRYVQSTYWIDRTDEAVRVAASHGSDVAFAEGNLMSLHLDGDRVCADSIVGDQWGQSIPLTEFVELLAAWRQRLIDDGALHGPGASWIEPSPATTTPQASHPRRR